MLAGLKEWVVGRTHNHLPLNYHTPTEGTKQKTQPIFHSKTYESVEYKYDMNGRNLGTSAKTWSN